MTIKLCRSKEKVHKLNELIDAYSQAPEIFHSSRYWQVYEKKIASEIEKADLNQLRSGRYPIFGTFGFNEVDFFYHPNLPGWKKNLLKVLRNFPVGEKIFMPYDIRRKDIREMAFHHCILQSKLSGALSISEIETSAVGTPRDLFTIEGKNYTMQFLSFYLRYCFAQKALQLIGDETVVELGSGSGFQVELLKKIHPNLTILCFDLPAPLYLCEKYLSEVFGEQVVSAQDHLKLESLDDLEKGKIHMFGNWQFPLLKDYSFDVFWNAASFGEMEPHIVENYLSYIVNNCKYIYLLQARQGKESSLTQGVEKKIKFEDYQSMLKGYQLEDESDVYLAHRKMSQSGGYFQAVWKMM
jgi:putative sugar O-methyltransferase